RLLQEGTLLHPPTHFETLTALAFHYFQQRSVEVAVIEVGLGGRFDATNALSQKVSIITTIGFDHEQFLGERLSEIAAEKAAILKPLTTVVTGILDPEAMRVVAEAAEQRNCHLRALTQEDFRFLNLDTEGYPIFEYLPWNDVFRVRLRGKHQAHNACVALLACEALQRSGLRMQRELVRQALQQVTWPGRLQITAGSPRILLDCAHNPMGVETLADFLNDFGWNHVAGLFTSMHDKKIDRMLSVIASKLEIIFLTRVPPYERCADRDELVQAAELAQASYIYEKETDRALEKAVSYARDKTIPLVVFGSIYLTGKIMSLLQHKRLDGV
ncbi:MAG TPA: Mur ligase family protein, partial [Acidobacteriota bacterium]